MIAFCSIAVIFVGQQIKIFGLDKKPLTLNTAEAAKVLGYSAEYVRKLDRDGKMPKRVDLRIRSMKIAV